MRARLESEQCPTAVPRELLEAAEQHAHRLAEDPEEGLARSVRRILDAAWDVLDASGAQDIKIEAVLRRARVSRRVFYHHFDGKAELIALMLRRKQDKMAYAVVNALEGATTPLERLDAWVRGMVRGIVDPPEYAFQQLLNRNAPELAGVPSSRRDFGALVRAPLLCALRDGVANGDFLVTEPERTGRAIWLMCQGLLKDSRFDDGGHDDCEVVVEAARVLCSVAPSARLRLPAVIVPAAAGGPDGVL